MSTPPHAPFQPRYQVRRFASTARGVLFWLVFAAAVVFAWPTAFGGSTGLVVVAGHSMDPTYFTGDLVITQQHSEVLVGDVVVYSVPDGELGAGMQVIHRVVAGDLETGLTTQGDNNPSTDIWHPRAQDVHGVVVAHLPKAGHALVALHSPLTLAALGSFVVLWLLWPGRDEPEAAAQPSEGADGDEQARTSTQEASPAG